MTRTVVSYRASRSRSPSPTQLDDLSKFRFPQAEYDEAKNQRDFECLRITYRSGGLRIFGFIYKPIHTIGRKLPAIIFQSRWDG